ncbi:hypothetical protein [Choristoneura occidentalis alphabaculovirus]|nr:hypothetical protein [Choristoneura occidentalis alphabaculovirus]
MRQRRPRFSSTSVLEKRVLSLDVRQRRPRFSGTSVLEKQVLSLTCVSADLAFRERLYPKSECYL